MIQCHKFGGVAFYFVWLGALREWLYWIALVHRGSRVAVDVCLLRLHKTAPVTFYNQSSTGDLARLGRVLVGRRQRSVSAIYNHSVNHFYSYNNYRNRCAITNQTITVLKCVLSVHKGAGFAKDVCLFGLHMAVPLQQGFIISNTYRSYCVTRGCW
jgi:hypothetical protein